MATQYGITQTQISVKSYQGWSVVRYGTDVMRNVFSLHVMADFPDAPTVSGTTKKVSPDEYYVWISPDFTGEGEAIVNGRKCLEYRCGNGEWLLQRKDECRVDFKNAPSTWDTVWKTVKKFAGIGAAKVALAKLMDFTG